MLVKVRTWERWANMQGATYLQVTACRQGEAAALTLALCQPQLLRTHLERQPRHCILGLVACTGKDLCW